MRHPKLERIQSLMLKGKDFEMTRQQYVDYTGIDLPQDKYYTEKRSAIAKLARNLGFEVIVVPEIIKFKRKGS